MVGLGGKQSFLNPTSRQLKGRICRYRRQHPAASCAAIARGFGISRQLAHKILKEAGVTARARKSAAGKRFYRFLAKARRRGGKHTNTQEKLTRRRHVAAALGIAPHTLWTYELPPEHPRHRDMPEEMREKYRELMEKKRAVL